MPLYHLAGAAAPIFLSIEPGILTNVSAFIQFDGEAFNETWIDVGITESLNSLESRILHCFSGYISYHAPLSWSGSFELKSGNQLYLDIVGNLAPAIKVFDKRIPNHQPIPGAPHAR